VPACGPAGAWPRTAEAEEALQKLTAGAAVAPGEAGGRDGDVAEGAVRRVGERLFVSRQGVWTDVRLEPDLRRVKVAPLSPAWFDLGRRLPGLRSALALGDRVIIAGDGLALELSADGIEGFSPELLEDLLQAFGAADLPPAP